MKNKSGFIFGIIFGLLIDLFIGVRFGINAIATKIYGADGVDFTPQAIKELEKFILELGTGFAFIERQKHMVIDGEDFFLDMLFYNRALHRLVAVELKLGRFKASYKGQMELYLRYLDKNIRKPWEESPMGLILCSEGNTEHIEYLMLDELFTEIDYILYEYLNI